MTTIASAQPSGPGDNDQRVQALLQSMRAHYLPGGVEAARSITRLKTTQRGEIRASPAAQWKPLQATEYIDATASNFCWEADLGTGWIGAVHVTDAYEGGAGRVVARKGPLVVHHGTGPDIDAGELQRYLAYAPYCPPMLVNHPTLRWQLVGPATLRVRDQADPTGTWVDLTVGDDGRVLSTMSDRPTTQGRKKLVLPWSTRCHTEREWSGLRIPTHLEAAYHQPDEFVYVKLELLSVEIIR